MADAHARVQSFEDRGTIHDIEVDDGETNVSLVNFHVRFIRDQVFQLTIESQRFHHAGPYLVVYNWNGNHWSEYNSLNWLSDRDAAETDADEDTVAGSGLAISYGLMPLTARLLCVVEPFRGFHGLDGGTMSIGESQQVKTAQATTDRLNGRSVYRLTLDRKVAGFHDLENYWIDPHTYTILKRECRHIKPAEVFGYGNLIVRSSIHAPKINPSPLADAVTSNRPQKQHPGPQ